MELTTLMRIRRRSLGYNLSDVADICGITKMHLSDVERCNRTASIDLQEKIRDTLGFTNTEQMFDRRPQNNTQAIKRIEQLREEITYLTTYIDKHK